MGRASTGFNAGATGLIIDGDLEPGNYGSSVTLVTGKPYTASHGDGPGSKALVVDAKVHSLISGSPVRQIALDAIQLD